VSIRATASTMGQEAPVSLAVRKPCRWRGTPGWTPDAPHLRETGPRRPGPPAEHPNSSAAKAARFAVYTTARDGGASTAGAGEAAGISAKTAQTYERQRLADLRDAGERP